jgi:hypothetical protein
VKGSSVPPAASAATARTGPGPAGAAGTPSVITVKVSAPSAAPRNCTAVTATGSRPGSRRPCATVNVADSSSEASTRPSPPKVAPPPPPPAVTRPTPATESAKPAQATGRATVCCHSAAMTATSTGTAPISSAAWVTLVRSMPAFCRMTDPPYPIAPEASSASPGGRCCAGRGGRPPGTPRVRGGCPPPRSPLAPRPPRRLATGRRSAAARPKRVAVSQPAGSHSRASLDSGTVVPHSSPAATRAATARRRLVFMNPSWPRHGTELVSKAL